MNTKKLVNRLNERGFSLIEMMIVIALIGFIGTFVLKNVNDKFQRAKVDGAKIRMRQVHNLLDDYKRVCSMYPTMDQGLKALVEKPTGGKDCRNYPQEAFVSKRDVNVTLKDPWDNEYDYKSDGNKMEIISFGADGQPGGDGFGKDISSEDPE